MEHLDLQVIRSALRWLEEKNAVWLCTVLATYGSAPRGPGSMLIARASGESHGSLSGGCVEEDFLERLQLGEFTSLSEIVRYGEGGLTPTRSLPCGGSLDVLVEYFAPDLNSANHLRELELALMGKGRLGRTINLDTGGRSTAAYGGIGATVTRSAGEVKVLIGPARRLIIAGLSPVAEFCAEFALALGFEVIICDTNPEQLEAVAPRFPMAELVNALPAAFIAQGGCHGATAVVALTHDPRLDDLTLMESVRTEAYYIGAMGSIRTSAKRLERLTRIAGLSTEELQRITAPIGLRLGSKTPAEIAIAVMADIVRVGNGVSRAAL